MGLAENARILLPCRKEQNRSDANDNTRWLITLGPPSSGLVTLTQHPRRADTGTPRCNNESQIPQRRRGAEKRHRQQTSQRLCGKIKPSPNTTSAHSTSSDRAPLVPR